MNFLKKSGHVTSRTRSLFIRLASNQAEKLNHRARLFDEVQHRQLKEIQRIEKIQVKVLEPGQECNLIMNKHLSTPYSCTQHMSELFTKRSVLAKIDGETLWDMHRPLENDCDITFMHFKDIDPSELNTVYWRSCAFVLGYALNQSFKDELLVELLSPTNPNIKNGSFSYDAKLHLNDWKPTRADLRCLSIGVTKMLHQNLKFERLKVTMNMAREIFKYDKYKLAHLDQVATTLTDQNEHRKDITVYKLGDFVDLSNGPMIGDTSQMGRFTITNIYDIESVKNGTLQRIQGISVPSQLQLHSWTYDLLVERASRPTTSKPASDQLKEMLKAESA